MAKEVALVTGGTSGIGKAQVCKFVADGFQVVFCAPKSEQESADRIVSELNGSADFIACDVSRAEEVEAMIAQIKQKHGRLHVIFNNAGVGASDGRLHEIPNDRYQLLTNVNQIGAFYVMKYGIKLMVELGIPGRIVNTSSSVGLCGITTGVAHYGATKAALSSMTRIASMEYLKEGIRVNAIAPAVTKTELVEKFIETCPDPKAMAKELMSCNPMSVSSGEFMEVSDISGVVSFLVGPDARFINGQTIPIDGGYSIQ